MDLEIVGSVWDLWRDALAVVPFWDPYGAVAVLFLLILAAGGALRVIFG